MEYFTSSSSSRRDMGEKKADSCKFGAEVDFRVLIDFRMCATKKTRPQVDAILDFKMADPKDGFPHISGSNTISAKF
jgi:hypothetical protein